MANATTYSANERVLCFHGPVIYEAKVLKTEIWDHTNTRTGRTGPHYLVHYKGWKQTWDEWVNDERLLKFNEANLAIQKTTLPNADNSKKKSSHHSSKEKEKDSGATSNVSGRRKDAGRKRNREEDEQQKKPELKIDVPDVLKVVLVDDWEAVTKNNQLVSLPREPNVVEILKEFAVHCEKPDKDLPSKETVLPTLIQGLQLYFDRSLGNNLLYRFERGQYAETRRQYVTGQHVQAGTEKEMSEVYGAEHLLRMLVNLPAMITQTSLDPESVKILKEYVVELLRFMEANKTRFFLEKYDTATSHYLSLMRS